jgi:hypothetical protein
LPTPEEVRILLRKNNPRETDVTKCILTKKQGLPSCENEFSRADRNPQMAGITSDIAEMVHLGDSQTLTKQNI